MKTQTKKNWTFQCTSFSSVHFAVQSVHGFWIKFCYVSTEGVFQSPDWMEASWPEALKSWSRQCLKYSAFHQTEEPEKRIQVTLQFFCSKRELKKCLGLKLSSTWNEHCHDIMAEIIAPATVAPITVLVAEIILNRYLELKRKKTTFIE